MNNRIAQLHDDAPVVFKRTAPQVSARAISRKRVHYALKCAIQGLRDAWASQPNLRIHGYFGLGLVALGLIARLPVAGWLWVAFAIGLVFFAELMNTAIEQTVDLVVGLRPDPLARQIKDIAASCVLVATILAVVIESFVFLPHLLRR